MHRTLPYAPLPHRLDSDALTRAALDALQADRMAEASELSLLLAAKFGPLHPEAHVVCAVVHGRAGHADAALAQWDMAVRRQPHRVHWLAQALRAAWSLEKTSPRAAAFAAQWQTLLERVFIAPPPPDLLAEMTARGWQGAGSAGMHQGRLRAWLWLPEREGFHVRVSPGGPRFSLGTVQTMTLGSHTLHILDATVPQTDAPFFLTVGDASGRHIQGSPLPCSSPRAALPARAAGKGRTPGPCPGVTVIVPVYGDRKATLACLASVFASRRHCRTPFTVLAVWDHGPDPALRDDLQRLAARGKIVFRSTPLNMGFLACVNHALSLVAAGDVILLNADTLVHGDWVDRMARAAGTPDAATVTALGSDAELVSFPSPAQPGAVRGLRQVRILDKACRALDAKDALREIPVGVGFCMAVTRRALDRLGGFDGFRLFSGYGEEVDLCLRALEAGLKNYVAANVFVAHLGGRSFGYAKKALAAQNNQALFARYPAYDETYTAFMRADALRHLREKISRSACAFLDAGTELDVRAWSDLVLPTGGEAQPTAPEPRATLFVLPCGGAAHAILRIRHEVPLADMHFALPGDVAALRALLRQCGLTSARAHSRSVLVPVVREALGLPVKNAPCRRPARLAPLIPTRGACLAEPPRTVAAWKRFCGFAAAHPETVFWVCRVDALWGHAPRPANVRSMPDCDDLAPLAPAALLLMGGADREALAAWRNWLTRHAGPQVPICGLPGAAA